MPDWGQVHVTTRNSETVEDALLELGALSVTLADAADTPVLEPAPGETPLWPELIVTGLFEAEQDLEAVRETLLQQGLAGATQIRLERLGERCWERAWLDDFAPMRFGQRLWVSPHEADAVWPADAVVLRMDPGLAFGTGTHPTTRLCLQWLDGADLSGAYVIDYGCGSGVLAVAAALLGAASVQAYDIDPQAITATRDNARANGVEDRIRLLPPDQPPHTAADIVLANILAGTLITLAKPITALVKPGGCLVMSGILSEQAQSVTDAYAEQFLLNAANSEAWVRLDGRRFAPSV